MQAIKKNTDNLTDRLKIPEKLKQRLYPSVLELFSDYDFHRVNVREISKRTGVSSGTIYKYFRSKEDLIITILDEYFKLFWKIMMPVTG